MDKVKNLLGWRRRVRLYPFPVLSIAERGSAKKKIALLAFCQPLPGAVAEPGVLFQPGLVGVKRGNERGKMRIELKYAFGGEDMDLSQGRRKILWPDIADPHRQKAFFQPLNLAKLPIAPFRCGGCRANEPDHRIGCPDEVSQFSLPFLAIGQVAPVYGDVEPGIFQRGDELIGDRGVLTRIGNEELKLIAVLLRHRLGSISRARRPVCGEGLSLRRVKSFTRRLNCRLS
ncbi:MAG: hypothetical protein MI753_01960 [Hyphomicrobiales bacterium]|nr:hypothetical protein [Hyphomicrobiales bacterium]